ncbi:GRR1-like protein 1 [Capsicum galapagoense]
MLPSRLNFVTGTYFAGIQADPDKCAGTKYQLIFSLICHEHHSLMSFILSHDTIRIPDLGMMITQSYKLQRMRVRGYVDEIGLEDIDTYCKDLETLGHFLMRKNRMYP